MAEFGGSVATSVWGKATREMMDGNRATADEDYAKAIHHYRAAIQLDPSRQVQNLLNLAGVFSEMEDYQESRRMALEAVVVAESKPHPAGGKLLWAAKYRADKALWKDWDMKGKTVGEKFTKHEIQTIKMMTKIISLIADHGQGCDVLELGDVELDAGVVVGGAGWKGVGLWSGVELQLYKQMQLIKDMQLNRELKMEDVRKAIGDLEEAKKSCDEEEAKMAEECKIG